MRCAICGGPTAVSETRKDSTPAGATRRKRRCAAGHETFTYEVTEAQYRYAKYGIEKKAAAAGRGYRAMIERNKVRAAQMRAYRLQGWTCQQIADHFHVSLDMARYYTRMPREKLYPAAKNKHLSAIAFDPLEIKPATV